MSEKDDITIFINKRNEKNYLYEPLPQNENLM